MKLNVLLLIALAAVLSPRVAGACSCMRPDLSEAGVAKALAQADVVLRGEVIHSETIRVPHYGEPRGYNAATYAIIEISGYWKGEEIDRIAIFSGDGKSDCGIPFKVGQSWLIFANYAPVYVPGALNTSMCTLSTKIPDTRGVEAKLGEPQTPRRPQFDQP